MSDYLPQSIIRYVCIKFDREVCKCAAHSYKVIFPSSQSDTMQPFMRVCHHVHAIMGKHACVCLFPDSTHPVKKELEPWL